jgi:hypothetical protein
MLVPEHLGRYLNQLGKQSQQLESKLVHGLDHVRRQSELVSSQSRELQETFLALNTALDEKDREIARLKAGYDAAVFRRFLLRFVRVDTMAHEALRDNQAASTELADIRLYLEDALAECGVEIFEPEVGSSYVAAPPGSIEDRPTLIPTTDPEAMGTVASVLKPGYLRKGQETTEYITPARVTVFDKQLDQRN